MDPNFQFIKMLMGKNFQNFNNGATPPSAKHVA
jgi:hypothetical protein